VACTYGGADACSPTSSKCCRQNDVIYDFLLSYPLTCQRCSKQTTPEKPIAWNFNKIFVDQKGRPWTDEILAAEDWDLSSYIDRMLSGTHRDADRVLAGAHVDALAKQHTTRPLLCFFGLFCMGIIIAYLVAHMRKEGKGAQQESGDYYLHVM
jgi:hypothetical protein